MPDFPPVSGAAGLALTSAVDRVFTPAGSLSRTLPEFEVRPGQRRMALAVSETFEHGGLLLAEAGTGTGKTLAYLVPAILSRQRVLVSTGTKNLQEQIFFKDLPLLRTALGLAFRATYMKGRGNYLCLQRFEALKQAAQQSLLVAEPIVALIDEWARHTETGDRAEIEDLPEDLPFWNEIAAATDNCVGSECPRFQECFVTRMRQRAAESDLVVVNHHLLCADAAVRHHSFGEVIPECSLAVIDEAHQLEDVATQYFGLAVSNYRLEELIRDGERLAGRLDAAQHEEVRKIRDTLARIANRAGSFFVSLQAAVQVREGGSSSEDRQRVNADMLAPVCEPGYQLTGALAQLEAAIELGRDVPEDLRALATRAHQMGQELTFLFLARDPTYVYFVERRGRGVFFRAAPIDVASLVRELLLDRRRGTTLTSATLSVNGSFDYVRHRLGIDEAVELRLPAEFDYARQAILYLPKRMPGPRSQDFVPAAAKEIIEILMRSRGRAFVLFTSYANLRQVEAAVRGVLPFPILVQGSAPRSVLLRQFRATANAVLLATSSFWQGVDVVGEALSCVIVDKLPFASPGDPITAARIEAVAARGGEPFGQYQLPLAILTLLQGLGRLIRHRKDRGVLAILDPRVTRMGYGRLFLQALPPAPITTDLGEVERFFNAGAD